MFLPHLEYLLYIHFGCKSRLVIKYTFVLSEAFLFEHQTDIKLQHHLSV